METAVLSRIQVYQEFGYIRNAGISGIYVYQENR